MSKHLKTKFLILIISLCSLICLFALSSNVIAAASELELIISGPGENASTEMLFTWRSKSNTSSFYYTDDQNLSLSKWNKLDVTGELDNTIFSTEKISNYRYKLELENLTPGTKYAYIVKSNTATSDTHYFQTAYETGDFNFLWVSDNHAYPGSSDRQTKYDDLYQEAKSDLINNIPLVLSTGDDTAYGGNYDNWQTLVNKVSLFKETSFISVPGNHTCYEYDSSNIPSTESDKFFDAILNTPENGTDEGSTSFWFLYNSVLFIGLDSIVANSKSSTYLPMQKEFFINTVESNEGKYQYIIVFQHYPFMNALTGSRVGPYGTNYEKWYELFDQYNVDIALSGDHHCYYRSNKLYDDQVVSEGGTVYIGAPQIGGRHREITAENDSQYYAKRITSQDLAGYSAVTYFNVTSKGITGTLIDTDGTVQDTYTIPAKRSVTWNDAKEEIASSISVASSNNKNYLCFNNEYAKFINTLEVYNGTTKILSVSPHDLKQSSFELSSLANNESYELKVNITYSDHTTDTFNINAHTYGHIGEIYGLKTSIEKSKLKLSWTANLQNNIVANYNVYVDDTLVSTLSNSVNTCEIDLSKVSPNSSYKLEAITSSKDVVLVLNTTHSLIGDASFDGLVNTDDINAIINAIKENKSFGENELKYLDINNNNQIDLGDAFTINAFVNNKLSSLQLNTFNVTIIDINGQLLYQEQVTQGSNSSFNTSSYNFNKSIKNITCDTTVVAVPK